MANQDDYNLIEDGSEPDPPPQRGSAMLVWFIVVMVLLIFGFAVGIAGVRLLTRMVGDPEPTAVAAEVPVATASGDTEEALDVTQPTATQPVNDGNTSDPTAPNETPVPTAQLILPTATWTPVPPTTTPLPITCQYPLDPSFFELQQLNDLGCPLSAPTPDVWAAWEPFERGSMIWRSDSDEAYVFTSDGRWFPVTARWNGEQMASRGAAPPGLQEPQRGFGYVWSVDDAIYDAVGWAQDEEKGFCARVQDFERGFVIQSSPAASCTSQGLYNWATSSDWAPLVLIADDRLRQDVGNGNTPDTSNIDSVRTTRPALHGTLFAEFAASPPNFDGSFSEWPAAWQPLNTVVYDESQFSGPADLQGTVQAAWSEEGLLLAVRVNDDIYRPGPNGTDMWQGDGIEIHFDRDLSGDYDLWDANEDDYQIGVSFGPDLDQINGYRWLPYVEESSIAIVGAIRPLQQDSSYRGYNAELLIPWSLFGADGNELSAGQRFGFNVSLNDNDSNGPNQQTTISMSPARSTHDNPTEWGTIVLLP